MNSRTAKALIVMQCVRQAMLEAMALNSDKDPAARLAVDLARADADLWLIFRQQSKTDEEANRLMKRTERPPLIKKLPGVSSLFGQPWLSPLDVQVSATGDYYMPGINAPEDLEERLILALENGGKQ